jgi:hypothetical protein
VLHFLIALRGLGRALVAVWRDPETKALPLIVGLLLLTGTVFYWLAGDWSPINSLYFWVVTLTTVGYGDLHPTSDYSRIFTIVYIFLGLGVLVAFVTSIAQHYMAQRVEDAGRLREHLHARSRHDQPQPPSEGESQ